jgi:hypothetical protein
MDWRGNLKANHKAEILRLREDIEFLRANPHDLAEEIIADNLRMIATLKRIIAEQEADTGQA